MSSYSYPEHELNVVGACFVLPGHIAVAQATGLTQEAFTDPKLRLVWSAMEICAVQGRPHDQLAVLSELRQMNQEHVVGGLEYLMSLTDQTPTTAYLEQHCKMLVDAMHARRLVAVCELARAKAKSSELSPKDYSSKVLSDIQNAALPTTTKGAQPMSELVTEWWADHDLPPDQRMPALARFGIPALDAALGNGEVCMEPGRVYVISARPAMGKSSLAMQAAAATSRGGGRVLVFSLEMPAKELTTRLLSGLTRIDANQITRRQVSQEQYDQLTQVSELLHSLALHVDDNSQITFPEIRARALAHRLRYGQLDLLVIDHIGLISADQQGDGEYEIVSKASTGAKKLAKELKCAVILLAQLNRKLEERADKRPMLADLRSSGAIEQDADAVVFLYRDHVYNKSASPGEAEAIIAKQRNGAPGTVALRWIGSCTMFDDPEQSFEHSPPSNDNAHSFHGEDERYG